ncbi:MAG: DEAD/DEAH box helicase family protein [Gemmatimonadetes bacterium]|nr:DEAD/DEAH box helicase family protein [Gemmatimonadota bacterium]
MKGRPYQTEAVARVFECLEESPSTLVVLPTGMGKAQPADTPVLTPRGWKPLGGLVAGESVVGSSGQPVRVLGVFPQGEREVYRVTTSDGASTLACSEHLWAVQTKWHKHEGRPWCVKSTSELRDDLRDGGGASKWFLPLVAPVEFAAAPVPLDPYVLGVLIGDGGLRHSVRFSSEDAELVSEVTCRLSGLAVVKHVAGCDYIIGSPDGRRTKREPRGWWLRGVLIDLGLFGSYAWEKRVPPLYMHNSVDVRVSLLRGLMDTDGHAQSGCQNCEFVTTSRGLADDVCELVRSLGGATRVRTKAGAAYTHNGESRCGRESYRITVTLAGINPFLLTRKAAAVSPDKKGPTRAIVSIEPEGRADCVCISVDAADSLYVTEGYIVTHNTIVMGMIAGQAEGRVLVVAHREELVRQNAEKIQRYTGEQVDVEMGDEYATETLLGRARIISASKDSLHPGRITRFNPLDFGMVLIDEAHHTPAKTYGQVIRHFSKSRVVGVTATPDRTDEKAMGQVFQTVAYEMTIRDGIEGGWLVPVRQKKIACESLDFGGIRKVGADFNQGQLAMMLEQEGPLHEMAVPTLEVACGVPRNTIDTLLATDPDDAPERFRRMVKFNKRTLIFAARVHHAELVVQIINRWLPGAAELVHGNTPSDERARIFERFGAGDIQFLANVGIATEGWDDPATDGKGVQIVSLMRPTQSRSLYSQMIGRGTRPLPGLVDRFEDAPSRLAAIAHSDKPSVLVLDFHGLSDSHSLIHAEDVLGGTFEDSVVQRAKKKAESQHDDEERDVLASLVNEEQEIVQEIAAEQRKRIRAGVRYSEQDVDPFATIGRRLRRVPGWFADKPPSQKQIDVLQRRGLWNPNVVTNMGVASQLLDAPTPKMQASLKRAGYSDGELNKMNFKQAREAMDAVASNGWKRPKAVSV